MQSYRNPKAQWLGSPNFSPNRNGHDMTQPSWIVIHTMVGSLASANSRFQQSSQQASATYGVGLDGHIVEWVDERDAAWANGATGRGGKGDNLDSISIEHEDNGDYNGPRTPELYAASAWLVHDICQRYAVPIDRGHVIGHRECDFSSTACPDALDVNRIVAAAAAGGSDMSAKAEEQINEIHDVLFKNSEFDWQGAPIPPYVQSPYIWSACKNYLPQILAAVKTPVVLDPVAFAAALAPHLGEIVDPVKLAADLAPHLGDDVAAAIAKRLANG